MFGALVTESLTKQFEQRIAEFLRRTQLTPSEFGERAIGDRKFYGDVRPGRSPRLATVDRVLAFMEAYEGAAARGSRFNRQREPRGFFLDGRRDGAMTRAVEPGRDAPARILRFHQVQARTGLSRSTIYRRLAGGSFPKPLSLGARAVGWIESEVDEWIRQRIVASRGEAE